MRKSLLLSIALLPSLALASGYSLPNVNPRDLGVCASAVAAQNDAGAAFTLPAALARFSGPSARIGFDLFNQGDAWHDPTGISPDTDMKVQFVPLPTAFVSYSGKAAPLGNRGWGVGAALSVFGGGAVKWPDDWAGRYHVVKVDRRVIEGLLTAGIEVIPQVRIGGGVDYTYTTEKLSQKVSMAAVSPLLPDATGDLDLSGGALTYDLSAEVDPLPGVPLRFAVDYKHKAHQTLKGDVKWSGVHPAAAALFPLLNDQDAEEKLTIPNRLELAVSYRAIKPLLLMFTYTLDRWVVYQTDHFTGSLPGAELTVDRKYRNGYTLRGGAEYDVMPSLTVRAGLQRDVSGLRPETYSPSLPDASSWAGSVGATYRFSRGIAADLGVFVARMDEVTSTNNGLEPPTVPLPTGTLRGTYDIWALIYGVGLSWTPGLVTAAQ